MPGTVKTCPTAAVTLPSGPRTFLPRFGTFGPLNAGPSGRALSQLAGTFLGWALRALTALVLARIRRSAQTTHFCRPSSTTMAPPPRGLPPTSIPPTSVTYGLGVPEASGPSTTHTDHGPWTSLSLGGSESGAPGMPTSGPRGSSASEAAETSRTVTSAVSSSSRAET